MHLFVLWQYFYHYCVIQFVPFLQFFTPIFSSFKYGCLGYYVISCFPVLKMYPFKRPQSKSKKHQHIRNSLLYDIIDMVKQLGIHTYFLLLSCADVRLVELSEKELTNLSYKTQWNLLNNKPILETRTRHFTVKLKYFSKKSHLMIQWEKQNIIVYILNFKKGINLFMRSMKNIVF